MKRLLIIGASVLQLPAIKRAKELGFYVGVVDYNPNAVGVSLADEYFNVSTIDEQGVAAVAKGFAPDGIMTLATDMPMRSIAVAAASVGLPSISYETAVRSTDKGEMIRAFEAAGVEHPWFYLVDDEAQLESLADEIAYPCVIKPTDNSGSRGVYLARSRDELLGAYAYSRESSRGGRVIVEEYLVGRELSVEIMVTDGEPHVLAVTDKLTTGAPHFVEMGHSQPSSLGGRELASVRDLACRAVTAVGITTGPAHVEIMLTERGPRMIELGARMGGDCITTHLVPLSTGVDMIEATIRSATGEKPDVVQKYARGSAIRYFDVPEGIIRAVSGLDEARAVSGVREITLVRGVGERSSEIGSSTDRVGFVIADGESAEDAIRACEEAISLVKIEIDCN